MWPQHGDFTDDADRGTGQALEWCDAVAPLGSARHAEDAGCPGRCWTRSGHTCRRLPDRATLTPYLREDRKVVAGRFCQLGGLPLRRALEVASSDHGAGGPALGRSVGDLGQGAVIGSLVHPRERSSPSRRLRSCPVSGVFGLPKGDNRPRTSSYRSRCRSPRPRWSAARPGRRYELVAGWCGMIISWNRLVSISGRPWASSRPIEVPGQHPGRRRQQAASPIPRCWPNSWAWKSPLVGNATSPPELGWHTCPSSAPCEQFDFGFHAFPR